MHLFIYLGTKQTFSVVTAEATKTRAFGPEQANMTNAVY